MTLKGSKLSPKKNYHLMNNTTGDIYEGAIFLGKFDSKDNYSEVTEEVYQEYMKQLMEGPYEDKSESIH